MRIANAEYARVNGFEYAEVSAKDNIGIDDLFSRIAKKIVENGDLPIKESNHQPVVQKQAENVTKSSCC